MSRTITFCYAYCYDICIYSRFSLRYDHLQFGLEVRAQLTALFTLFEKVPHQYQTGIVQLHRLLQKLAHGMLASDEIFDSPL